jgi:lipopolysaccharide biosynthesis glycosyltransferase
MVSAIQARRNCSSDAADVIVFCLGLGRYAEDVFGPAFQKEGIILAATDREVVEDQPAMLARFFLNSYVPQQYGHYLYLDGDVHIHASLDPLIHADIAEGHFLAANDPMTFQLAEDGPQSGAVAAHFNSLGLSPRQACGYFNSGVLRINRKGWEGIGREAWEYYRRHRRIITFPDQDPLNVVASNRRERLSLAWNFPVFMYNSRVRFQISPKITHFMSSPKPWHGSFPPWTRESYKPYADALKRYPELAPFRHRLPLRTQARYQLQQRGKQITELITWGLTRRRDRILGYETACRR